MGNIEQMEYVPFHPKEPIILDKGSVLQYEYKIVSYGTHPCAYVKLPIHHKYFGMVDGYDDMDIECHGGLTYARFDIFGDFWIGWDYAHGGDFKGSLANTNYFSDTSTLFGSHRSNEKKWTTEEILVEVIKVIQQLNRLTNK